MLDDKYLLRGHLWHDLVWQCCVPDSGRWRLHAFSTATLHPKALPTHLLAVHAGRQAGAVGVVVRLDAAPRARHHAQRLGHPPHRAAARAAAAWGAGACSRAAGPPSASGPVQARQCASDAGDKTSVEAFCVESLGHPPHRAAAHAAATYMGFRLAVHCATAPDLQM